MVDKYRFQERVSLITGAGSDTGIGFATARIMGQRSCIIKIDHLVFWKQFPARLIERESVMSI